MKLLSWDDFITMCFDLALKIQGSRFKPDVIIAVGRDGLIPARILSDILQNRELFVVRAEHYVSKSRDKVIISQPLNVNLSRKDVLIVDDAVDTGLTLITVTQHIKKSGAKKIKTAVLFYNKDLSKLVPDFFIEVVKKGAGIVYPWRVYGTVINIIRQQSLTSRNPEEIVLTLKENFGLDVDFTLVRNALKVLDVQ